MRDRRMLKLSNEAVKTGAGCDCSHTVNLLTNMPHESFEELLTPANDDSPSSEACAAALTACDEAVYDGKNMEAIIEMLSFLHARLDIVSCWPLHHLNLFTLVLC